MDVRRPQAAYLNGNCGGDQPTGTNCALDDRPPSGTPIHEVLASVDQHSVTTCGNRGAPVRAGNKRGGDLDTAAADEVDPACVPTGMGKAHSVAIVRARSGIRTVERIDQGPPTSEQTCDPAVARFETARNVVDERRPVRHEHHRIRSATRIVLELMDDGGDVNFSVHGLVCSARHRSPRFSVIRKVYGDTVDVWISQPRSWVTLPSRWRGSRQSQSAPSTDLGVDHAFYSLSRCDPLFVPLFDRQLRVVVNREPHVAMERLIDCAFPLVV
ncbi:hypothetical protein HUW46_09171 [Amycolatopsis sp. CA-230715]|nr:hypothetical protein HUW46_09171 [Amycolatopsis sp. CA-230715]